MIAKDLMPWMFVKRTATWTPYVRIRSETVRSGGSGAFIKVSRRPGRRPPHG